ncbi:MAG: PP2C family protein-serine/threonine phosphatase [Bacteroidota bacterium]
MPKEKDYKTQYHLKQMELNSLLEITEAINNNLPEEALYKIYDFTVRANLNIAKYALLVYENDWEAKVSFGTSLDEQIDEDDLPLELIELREITSINGMPSPFDQFEVAIPILHKTQLLAIVLASGREEDESSLNTTFLQAISNLIIVAIENKRLARRQLEEESIRKELEIAKNVQSFLFPGTLPDGVRLKVKASYLPHHTVGGDYYDYIPINKNQFLVCIADVSGKGIPAAIMMSNFQASLHTMLRHTSNLTEIVEALNYQIHESAKGESFITFFVAIYDHELSTMVYVNAGHNPPMLFDNNGKMEELTTGTTVLGIFEPLPFISEGFIPDLDGFTLLTYTDGLTETENMQGVEIGSEKITEFMEENYKKSLTEIHDGLLNEIEQFRGDKDFKDDITILSCKVEAR